jgi:hypothetical protein
MEGPIITYLIPSTTFFSVVGVVVVGVVVVDNVVSVTTAVESTVTAESVVAVVDAPPQAANVAIATIANTFFIIYFLFILKYTT